VNNVLAALVPPGVVTSTLAVPAVPAGVVAVIEVTLLTVMPVAAVPPMVTAVAPTQKRFASGLLAVRQALAGSFPHLRRRMG
jgi:hypothetical protein